MSDQPPDDDNTMEIDVTEDVIHIVNNVHIDPIGLPQEGQDQLHPGVLVRLQVRMNNTEIEETLNLLFANSYALPPIIEELANQNKRAIAQWGGPQLWTPNGGH